MSKTAPTDVDLNQDELARLVAHLKTEELHAADARLSSIDSLQAWIATHPVLKSTGIIETVQQYGPAILEILKRLLGI